MGAVMYFSMIRPQKKQQQKRKEMFSGMKKGDNITTIGGLHGVIDSIDNEAQTVVVDCDGIYLTFNIGAIRDIKPQGTPDVPGVTTKAEPKVEAKKEATEEVKAEVKEEDKDVKPAKTGQEAHSSEEDQPYKK